MDQEGSAADRSTRPPTRRAVVAGGLTAGALAWVVPTIVSVPAAAAATVAPGLVIDPFTIPAVVAGVNSQTTVIDPVDGVSVTRRISTNATDASLTIANGIATFVSGGASAGEIEYFFGSPINLSGFTELDASCAITGTLVNLLCFVAAPGGIQQAPRFATEPVARFDLTIVVPDNLASVTSLLFIVSGVSLDVILGPLTAA